MTASQQAKKAGFKSLKQVAEISGKSRQNLDNWHKNQPKLFEIILIGCVKFIETDAE